MGGETGLVEMSVAARNKDEGGVISTSYMLGTILVVYTLEDPGNLCC